MASVFFYRYNDIYFLLGPSGISTVSIESINVTVDLTAPPGNPAIVSYNVSVVGGSASQTCTIISSASPLRCTITDLSAYTAYLLRAVGCLPGGAGCGFHRETGVRTRVNGKFFQGFLSYISHIDSHFLQHQPDCPREADHLGQ